LGIEERPFKRLTKRLLAPNTPIQAFFNRSKEGSDGVGEEIEEESSSLSEEQRQQFLKELQRFREDVILDFAAFESSIARIQFLRAANEKERDRYAAEKFKIENTAEEVRNNTARLRIQLDEAQRTLAIRKTYDVLADKITKNAALKPRDEQHVNIEKLKAEIEELERESQEHSQAWFERREQFTRLVNEGARLRRLMRDEKEPEREEEQPSSDQEDDHTTQAVGRDRDPLSNVGTPRPIDDAPTPLPHLHSGGALTPRSTLPDGGAATPPHDPVKDHKDAVPDDVDMEGNVHYQRPEEVPVNITVTSGKTGDDMDTS